MIQCLVQRSQVPESLMVQTTLVQLSIFSQIFKHFITEHISFFKHINTLPLFSISSDSSRMNNLIERVLRFRLLIISKKVEILIQISLPNNNLKNKQTIRSKLRGILKPSKKRSRNPGCHDSTLRISVLKKTHQRERDLSF